MNERPSKKPFIGRVSREDKRNNGSVFPSSQRKRPICQTHEIEFLNKHRLYVISHMACK